MPLTPPTDPARKATAGRCGCGARVVRGHDQTGTLATVDIHPLDAATELRAWDAGTPTYTQTWHAGIILTIRSVTDVIRAPAGFTPDRVVRAHTCPPATSRPARKDTRP